MLALPLACALTVVTAASAATAQGPAQPNGVSPRPSFAEPAISPDRSEIAFVSGGDIWVVPATGGEARLLISHPAAESRPMYSPDGRRLAFVSTRAGSPDIWVLRFATGELQRLTFDDGAEQLDGWSRDGKWIYFSSAAHDIAGMTDVYRVASTGGTPMPVAADRYANEFMAAPSPTGDVTALVARGFAQSQWWRRGRSHLDESELWLVRGDGARAPAYEQLTGLGAKQQWPMWSPDGASLYFVSDRGGAQNLWVRPPRAEGEARQLTTFRDGRVVWPTIAYDGRTIVFERDFGIWTFDVGAGQAREVPIALRGASSTPEPEHVVLTNAFSELVLSPDGKKIAFVAHGDVFVASAAEGGDAERVTATPGLEGPARWAPDSRRLVYAAHRDGAWHLYLYDVGARAETQLTSARQSDASPQLSPDGKLLAFIRGGRELRVLTLDTRQERVAATGTFGLPPFTVGRALAWSPDGRWIAYLSGGPKLFVNAYVVPVAGGAARQVSWLPNTRASSVSWSPDGSFLLLDSGQRLEEGMLARVDLLPRTPRFREDQFSALFRDETPGRTTPPPSAPRLPAADSAAGLGPAARPDPAHVRIVFEGIRQRLSIMPVGVDVGSQSISPDGKQVLLVETAAGQQNLYTYSLDELAAEPRIARQITTTAGNKTSAQYAPDGKSILFLEQGRVVSVPLDTRAPKQIVVRAELDVDFAREKNEVFQQAWEFLDDNFYDPRFHGVDWAAVRTTYAPRIAGARSPDEMRRLLSLMVGELNASHMGIGGPPGGAQPVTGRVGLRFERAAYEQRGELRITEVVPLSPAALAGGIKPGDYLVAVDGARTGAGVNLDSLLAYKVGKRVTLGIAASAAGASRRDVPVRAINAATEKGLLYRAWVEERRAYVTKVSNGRLGYVHMLDMGGGALAQLNLDLDSENHTKEGVVLDIRNNNGGFVNGHALDVLSRQPYVVMVRRGVPAAPGRPVLGQRALEAPTVLVTNQHTLSDGENFTEGYRTMHLGKVVGEPTAGWDVYTGSGTMVDGTTVRLPFMENASLDLKALELVPRQVDVPVERPMGESYSGRDAQLDAAVKVLLSQIAATRTSPDARR